MAEGLDRGAFGRQIDGVVAVIATLTLSDSSHGAEICTCNGPSNAYSLPVGGVAEARVYFPGDSSRGVYNWPAWWASGPNWPSAGESDIAEGLSGSLTVNYADSGFLPAFGLPRTLRD